MKENEFNEWYKSSFDQLREEPPADVWDNIQGELDVNWYKSGFEQLREEPPADVWDNIQGELDVQEVWTRVDSKLTFFNRRSTILKWSCGIAAALIIAGGVSLLDRNVSSLEPVVQSAHRFEYIPAGNGGAFSSIASNDAGSKSFQASNENAGSSSSNNFPVKKQKKTKKNGSSSNGYAAAHGTNDNQQASSNRNAIPVADDQLALAMHSTAATSLEFQNLLTIFLNEKNADNSIASIFDPSVSPDSIIASKTLSGIGIGATSAYNNTWIMNPTTFAGLKTKALYRSRVSMASAYGLSGTYDLNPFWGVEAALMSSTQRQVYSYFNRAGEYKEKDNTLGYYQATILLKKKKPVFCGGKYNGIIRTLSVGPTARYLHSATDETNGKEKGASYQYSKNDYGITIDYGYDIPVMKKIMLSPGITAYAGVKDISRGKLVEPTHFNRTHNASLGLRVSARYVFQKK